MKTITDFLSVGMKLPSLKLQPTNLEQSGDVLDVITGEQIQRGYSLWDVVPSTSGEYLDMLHGKMSGYVSENTARALCGTWNMGSWLIFEDGSGYHPLIASNSTKRDGRPIWSSLVRDVWPKRRGQRVLCILATDVKKRVWHRARIGVLSERTDVFIFDNACHRCGVFPINWEWMIEILDFIEEIYYRSFSKASIRENLLHDLKTAHSIGLSIALELEKMLASYRGTPEFDFALTIAQKGGAK